MAPALQPRPEVRLEFIAIEKWDIPKVVLQAHVTNPASVPLTVLRWNSILDPQAGLLGTVSLRNHDTAKEVEVPSIMVNRQMPPPKEEYVRIEAGGSVSNEVKIALVTDMLEDGVEYDVLAAEGGRFMEIYYGEDKPAEPASVAYECKGVRFKA